MPEGATDVVVDSVEDVLGKDGGSEGDAGTKGDATDVEPKELTGSETDEQIAAHFAALEGKPMTKGRVEQLTRLSQGARQAKAVRERADGLEVEVKGLQDAVQEVADTLDKTGTGENHAAKLKELGVDKYLRWVTGGDEDDDEGDAGAASVGLDPSDPRDKIILELQAESKAREETAKQAKLDVADREAADAYAADMDSALKTLNTGSAERDDLISRVATSLFIEAAATSKDGDLRVGPFVTKASELFGKLGSEKQKDDNSAEVSGAEVVEREREVPLDETDDDEDNEAVNSLVKELAAKAS